MLGLVNIFMTNGETIQNLNINTTYACNNWWFRFK